MINRELVAYIHSVSDFPQERIKAVLVQTGWSLEQIESAFIQAKHERSLAKKLKADNARIGAIAASFIFVVMLLASSGTPVTGNLVYSNPSQLVNTGIVVSEEIVRSADSPQLFQSCFSLNSLDRDKCFLQEATNSKDILKCRAIVHAHLRDLCANTVKA